MVQDGVRDAGGGAAGGARGRWFVVAVALLAGAGMAAGGVWALAAPHSFAEAVGFPVPSAHAGGAGAGSGEHFVQDVGAFQLGVAAALLLACVWYDALLTALAGFVVLSAAHAGNHVADIGHGGHGWEIPVIAGAGLAAAAAFAVRLRQLGWVTGGVETAARAELAPYVRQKTVLLTTYRRDGGSGGTPVSIAVEGDHAYVRSFANSVKTRRLGRDPRALVAPCTTLGRRPGRRLPVRLRRLERGGAEDRHAARVLRAKYPFLHGALVPFMHRVLLRRKAGRTVHFEVAVDTGGARKG
ncbi:PPOX class F420-dependent oxidoreductase [Streptomyces winkii]|uniref:PPOX class F420-dependent oxidoreductase n=1 Tax=Streptomyces winkii TaxID=3051178 RepID=UPI0028D67732|nr:PPOX class F420-dependent oxidoreductase [Streptomyces sp. DSM 40971]